MPIKLGLPKDNYWIELDHKVRLFVRPLTTALFEASRSRSRRLVAEFMEQNVELIKVGASIEGLPDLRTEGGRDGLAQLIFVQALAADAVVDWEGIVDNDSEPLAWSIARVEELMRHHGMADGFLVKYTRIHDALVVEGKGSRSSPPGISGADQTTARDADASASPAPPRGE